MQSEGNLFPTGANEPEGHGVHEKPEPKWFSEHWHGHRRHAPTFLALHVDTETDPMALKKQFPLAGVTYGVTGSAVAGDRTKQPKSSADSISSSMH
jgi:hypothetical protein